MLFNTWEFATFFLIVFGLYHCLAVRWQNVLLVAASYVFYGWWDWRFLSLLLLSTVVDFCVGTMMVGAQARRRKGLLLISICTNLGILGFFKYFNFFVDSLAGMLESFGLSSNLPVLEIILPVGISFYTFQTMAYTIDVYRRRLEPTNDFVLFAVYVSFFPQLVAGPIERAQHLLPQFAQPRRVDAQKFSSGAVLFLIGLLRKVVIADQAAAMVDPVFADPQGVSHVELLRGVFLFGLQIYGDFAGYTDMARGISRMLGIELMKNFDHPYFATNITDFWRRWHISLSSWLRDYLYIPLGGSRKGPVRTYANLMITMLLGGLWHGAAWTFVIWGGLHGAALAIHKLILKGRKPLDRPRIHGLSDVAKALSGWLLTMALVWLAWVFFRAPDFGTAIEVIRESVTLDEDPYWGLFKPAIYLVVLLLAIDVPQYVARKHEAVLDWPWLVRGVVYAASVLCLVIFWRTDEVPFIYFQF